jgi:hypothetical protein
MNNMFISDIYFMTEVIYHDKMDDRSLEKYGLVISDHIMSDIAIEKGFVIISKSFAQKMTKTILRNLPGRKLVETFSIFCYENGLNLNSDEFKEVEFEMFRILIGNGIIKSISPSKMIKASKAMKVHGFRALLAAAVSGESKHIRAWRCLTCKRLRTDSKGVMKCDGFYHPVPEGLETTQISSLYPDNKTVDGIMMSSYLHNIPKVCMVIKPRVPIKLTKSVVYELDDQLSIIRKTMDIDVR